MEWIDEVEGYNGSFKSCWQPRAYQKLDSGGRRVRRSKKKLGGGWRQRLSRIKVSTKLKILQKVSPRRIFACIHQAYVRTMLGFGRKLWTLSNDMNEFGGILASPRKEYDELVVLQLQNLLLERKHRLATVGTTDASPCGEIRL